MTQEKFTRPTWDEYFMAMARLTATRANCDRLHTGAILVKDKRIIATGYNGAPPGQPNCNEVGHLMENGHCVRTIHAEHNAILQASRLQGASTEGTTLYTLYAPCIHCAKYLIAAGVKRIVYDKIYRNPDIAEYLKKAGIEVDRYQENKNWLDFLRDLFTTETAEVTSKEGEVKIEGQR